MSNQLVQPRKRRPPASGTPVQVRFQPPDLAALDDWTARQGEGFTRPEAIRRLVQQALAAKPVPVKFLEAKVGRSLRNVEQDLDDALGGTFPASDPVEMEEPTAARLRKAKPRRKR